MRPQVSQRWRAVAKSSFAVVARTESGGGGDDDDDNDGEEDDLWRAHAEENWAARWKMRVVFRLLATMRRCTAELPHPKPKRPQSTRRSLLREKQRRRAKTRIRSEAELETEHAKASAQHRQPHQTGM